jgi:hypothetical protein
MPEKLAEKRAIVIPWRANGAREARPDGANPESITTIGGYGFRACASKSAVADLDNDIAELG